jgi:hypothetical protein
MNAPICCINAHKIASEAKTFADRPELGQGEVAERPIAVPKVSSTNEIAAASTAPANTAPHSTKLVPGAADAEAETGVGPTVAMTVSSRISEDRARSE